MNNKTLVVFLSILLVAATMVFAQSGNRGYPPRGNVRANRLQTFDVANPVEIVGTIVSISQRNYGYGRYRNGLELLVKTKGNNLSVRLGPKVFFDSKNWTFKQGDKVQIIAYNGTGQSKGLLFAARITMNDKTLILRDQYGIAQWRWGRRGGRGRW